MKLYLAGPLFNQYERQLGLDLRLILLKYFDVYLPALDGALLPDLIQKGDEPVIARRKIFDGDITAIKNCDLFFIILNGRSVDEGAAVELGVAWALGKRIVGFKDDFRQLTSSGDNPMIDCTLEIKFSNFIQIESWLADNFKPKPH